jgi:hypothetical protein
MFSHPIVSSFACQQSCSFLLFSHLSHYYAENFAWRAKNLQGILAPSAPTTRSSEIGFISLAIFAFFA